VRTNPSATAQRELLLFCEANDFVIHEDGDLLAYKAVRPDYKDKHSGRFDNSVGQVVEMPRDQVDDRREETCSFGLHFAAWNFASTFGTSADPVMVIKVNPRDVVSIPHDYNNQKGRCCRYEVIAERRKGVGPLPQQEVYTTADVTGRADLHARVVREVRDALADVLGYLPGPDAVLFDLELTKSQLRAIAERLSTRLSDDETEIVLELDASDLKDTVAALIDRVFEEVEDAQVETLDLDDDLDDDLDEDEER
jgi:hypothetical protein